MYNWNQTFDLFIYLFFLRSRALHDVNNLRINAERIDLQQYQCPICQKYLYSSENREKHEVTEHPSPPLITDSSDDTDLNLENETSTGQQEFLVCLSLVKKVSNELKATERLAKRKNLMKGLKLNGNDPGLYKCHFCS